MKRDIRDFLNDIDAFAAKAEQLVNETPSQNLTQFSTEGMALILAFQIIGEAVKNIPQEVKDKYPETPWKQIAGMRDRLVHNYWSTSMLTITETAKQHLGALRTQVQLILKELEQ
ncbi:MAG: DUF86 domain-containing protein [Saprospiraceae bacterium]|nr:DUF86 domain-containing protein [Saprospiraceae bacterium]